jgi:hypothetical protein
MSHVGSAVLNERNGDISTVEIHLGGAIGRQRIFYWPSCDRVARSGPLEI